MGLTRPCPPPHAHSFQQAINGGNATWFGIDIPFDLNTLLAVEFVAMAAAESRRGDESDAAKRIYPGAHAVGAPASACMRAHVHTLTHTHTHTHMHTHTHTQHTHTHTHTPRRGV